MNNTISTISRLATWRTIALLAIGLFALGCSPVRSLTGLGTEGQVKWLPLEGNYRLLMGDEEIQYAELTVAPVDENGFFSGRVSGKFKEDDGRIGVIANEELVLNLVQVGEFLIFDIADSTPARNPLEIRFSELFREHLHHLGKFELYKSGFALQFFDSKKALAPAREAGLVINSSDASDYRDTRPNLLTEGDFGSDIVFAGSAPAMQRFAKSMAANEFFLETSIIILKHEVPPFTNPKELCAYLDKNDPKFAAIVRAAVTKD